MACSRGARHRRNFSRRRTASSPGLGRRFDPSGPIIRPLVLAVVKKESPGAFFSRAPGRQQPRRRRQLISGNALAAVDAVARAR